MYVRWGVPAALALVGCGAGGGPLVGGSNGASGDIAVDATHLYYRTDHDVRRIRKDGGGSEVVATTPAMGRDRPRS